MEVQSHVQENAVTDTDGETAERRFQCDLCEASFKRKATWQIHIHLVHKTYPCKPCGIAFTDEIMLLVHTVLVHKMRAELDFIATGMMDNFDDGDNLFSTDVMTGDDKKLRSIRKYGETATLYFLKEKTFVPGNNLVNQYKETLLEPPNAKKCARFTDQDIQEEKGDFVRDDDHLNENDSIKQTKPKKTVRFLLDDLGDIKVDKQSTKEDIFHTDAWYNGKDLKKPSKKIKRSLKFWKSGNSDEDRLFYQETCKSKNHLNKRTEPKVFTPVLLADEIELEDNKDEKNSSIYSKERTFVPVWADDGFKEGLDKIATAKTSLNFWSDDDDDDDDNDVAGSPVFQCNSGCNKILTSAAKLFLHKRTHRRKKPFPCAYCWRSYRSAAELATHSGVHYYNTPYKCVLCNMAFATKPYLYMHIMQIHQAEEPERCELCHKRFTEKYRLTMHVRIHYGEKPHECDICGSSFNWEAQLTQHLWAHHWGLQFKS